MRAFAVVRPAGGLIEEVDPGLARGRNGLVHLRSDGGERNLEIGTVAKSIFDETKDVIITWFGVLSNGPSAFARLDLGSNSVLLFALRFLFYVSLVDFAVGIPSAAANGTKYDDKMFIGLSITSIYVEYLAAALIIYGAMKILGGKASLQACLSGYCFLTAYLPIAAVLRLPSVTIVEPAIKAGANYPDISQRASVLLLGLPPWDKSVFVLASVLSLGVYIYFLINVYRCFAKLHGLSGGRAVGAFLLGLFAALIFAGTFIMPFDGAISRGFSAK
jgi:hypothetical protein